MASDSQKSGAIHHIVHEYANFISSAEMVKHGVDIDGVPFKPPINTHVGHAFYLNCRKLADFFQKRDGGRDKDSVLAEHYVPGFTPSLTECDKWRIPMNKQLAHITYFRDGMDAREIDRNACIALYRELQDAWREFRRRLPVNYANEFIVKVSERKSPYASREPSEFRNYDLD